jgi:hypothetical protein
MIRFDLAIFPCLAAIGAVSAEAQATPAPSPVCTVTATFVSQDLFRGYYLGGSSIEPSIDLSNGAYDFGYWSNSTVSNRVQGPMSTEVEVYGSYLFEAVKNRASVEPGFTLYALPWGHGFYGRYKASIEPYIGASLTLGGVQLSPRLYDDLVLKVVTWEFNATYAVPLKAAHTELDLDLTYGADISSIRGPGVPDSPRIWTTYWLFGVAAPFQVGKRGTLTLGFNYTGSASGEPGAFGIGGLPVSSRGLVTVSFAVKL